MLTIKATNVSSVIFTEDLKQIQGDSAVGILGSTLTGATIGVKLCSAAGPYAIAAACGVGGAVVGASFGVWTGV